MIEVKQDLQTGHLAELAKSQLIRDSVGEQLLTQIASGYLELLQTSLVIYEKNGDIALDILTSGWCCFLDRASRDLCKLEDGANNLEKCLCHESCWTSCSKLSIATNEPVDIECNGGIHIYSVPIRVKGEAIGAINFGYGDPPKEEDKLQAIAEKYQVSLKELQRYGQQYQSRPDYILKVAKRGLTTSASLIGEIVERKQAENKIQSYQNILEDLVRERATQLELVSKEQMGLEDAVRQSKALFHTAFWYSGVGISIVSIDGHYLQANPALCRILGYDESELLKMTFHDVTHPDDIKKDVNLTKGLLEGKKKFFQIEKRYIHKLGHIIWAWLTVSVVWDSLGKPLYIIGQFQDITESKRIEKEMVKLDKLNVVGQMAAGIGHEIRNPMTTVRGFLQLLRQKEEFKSSEGIFNLMIDELDRANSIITEFLSLAGNRSVELEKQNLNNIVSALAPLLVADAIKNGKYINIHLGDLPEIYLNAKEIRQVILNLFRNGIEAMAEGGMLTIRTYREGAEIVLEVEDQGTGIAKEISESIGTPFLTTKDNGTGLGLSICYNIAKSHNATIDFDTGSKGTTFKVKFKADS